MTKNSPDVSSPGRDPKSGRFLAGNSGNGGRKPGSRNKLAEAFITDAYEEWKISGSAALKKMSQDDPSAFCRLIGGLLPKELDLALSIESDLFKDCADFVTAFRLARQFIGAEGNLLMVDVTPEPAHERD